MIQVVLEPLSSYFLQVPVSYVLFKPSGNICLHLSCFNFGFLGQIRLQPRDDIDDGNG